MMMMMMMMVMTVMTVMMVMWREGMRVPFIQNMT
jgi:hypothetical protein